jgi:predicted alpha/beta superfamily hydrolase
MALALRDRLRRWWPVLAAVAVTAVVTALVTRALVVRHSLRRELREHLVTERLQSRVLGEERRLLVHLPDSYARQPSRRYPVLYVLDGERQDLHTAATARVMARLGSMPEVLVVGVVNPSRATRLRDYNPPYPAEEDNDKVTDRQGDRFLRFLETEVIPYIEGRYRTQPTRMLAGHSLGGLFALYTLFERPALFQARFAFSASLWVAETRLRQELDRALKANPAPTSFLYMSLGEEERVSHPPFELFVAVLRRSAGPGLRWRAEITPGADHGNNARLSTPVALQAYYRP